MTTDVDLGDRAGYEHFETVTLRYSDQDPMGHINNVAIIALLEAGRLGFFMQMMCDFGRWQYRFVLANVTVDFRREIRFPGNVEVGGRLLSIGKRSILTGYAVFQGDTVCVTSTSVNVGFDPETRQSAPLDPELLKRMKTHIPG